MDPVPPLRLKQISFYLLLVALGVLILFKLSAFIPAFLGAVTFYVIMRRSMMNMVYKRKMKKSLSATILIVVSVLVVLVPLWVFTTLVGHKITDVVKHSNQVLAVIQHFSDTMKARYGLEILSVNNIDKAGNMITTMLPNILGATFNTLTSVLLMYFMLYFMLTQCKEMEAALIKYIPLKDENVIWLGKDLQELTFNNAIGVPLIAFAQGFVALTGYLIFGVPDALFWFVLTVFGSMLPIIGAAAAYVPLSILLLAQGPAWKGIAVLIYGLAVVGLTDNVFRFALQKKLGDVHPLITIFGVVLGINLFGFIGLIFGPILISLFVLLVRIYVNEFGSKQTKR
ncbi:AI-2E family transporter [Ilyomonas limi]|uniref:AI-2E family transporter n=1 Tax=Ilyomonas limi TaxID=2575867 RepID=A0A4U3L587_9BACT|nr:AI-2E family transporter [Ilyomonas limi]TKK70318.1 AI-2E family transporter [Ilyomonas limi]